MTEVEALQNLKAFYDKIFEYLPANEATENESETTQQENQTEQPKTKPDPPPKTQKPQQIKYQPKPAGAKIRPGFEGPRVIRTKRQQK
ncbi:hypothetical protein TRFO_02397 [Tritrichomonas foetus]|uniref:Uncharacterized protein n=1 Tax=Tritrichomonas foetus TaxID=1144522 RepID=A0A1J4J6Q3_9EUKA|nr:hypothetical protein TRFO_02397 [Tritrichomonas foetus]|eukprot:OHS93863.1 hypothetical protein TRFO_02397 [Tritrichomonas foetus]